MNRWIPWIVALLALVWIYYPSTRVPRPAAEDIDTSSFGRLPVLVGH